MPKAYVCNVTENNTFLKKQHVKDVVKKDPMKHTGIVKAVTQSGDGKENQKNSNCSGTSRSVP